MSARRILPLILLAALLPGCKWAFAKVVETLRYVARYDNGVPKKEGTLADGAQTGKWTFYYEDGRKRSEGSYENDHQVGAWTSWFENGHLEWQGHFDAKGARSGAWTFYRDGGQVRAAGRFDNDLELGRWTFFGADGSRQRAGDFVEARMTGWWRHDQPDGSLAAAGLLFDGKRVGTWFLREQDAVTTEAFPLPAGVELVRDLRPDGSLRRTGLLRGGAPIGGWATFAPPTADAGPTAAPRLRATCVFEGGAVRAFACFGAGADEVLAEGLIAGGDLVDWSALQAGGMAPQDRLPLALAPPDAADDGDPAPGAPIDRVLAARLAELRAPATAVAAPAPTPAPTAPVAVASPRVEAPKQPEWTVLEEKELQAHVQDYLKGHQQAPASFSRYAIPKAMQGKPRRRADLEGQPMPIEQLRATDGTIVKLADFVGKKRLLVVVLRGFFGQVCVYCVAQTEALAQCHDRFDALNMEVLILYPGPEGNEQAFLQAYEETFGKGAPPYRVFYDPDLAVVKRLGIEGGDLAYPTTIFVDDRGVVRYAYTGAHRADRPAAEQLLEFVNKLDAK